MKKRIYNAQALRMMIAVLFLFGLRTQAAAQTVICEGEPLVLTLNGYTGSIQWEYAATMGGSYTSVPSATGDSAVIFPSASGWYRAAVSNGTCATFYSDSLELIVNPRPSVNAGADLQLCQGSTDTLEGMATGGTGSYSYSWSPAAGLSSTTVWNPELTAIISLGYVLTVTDSLGCMSMDTASVGVWNRPQVFAGPDDSVNCGGSVNLAASATGNGPLTVAWTPTGGLSNPAIYNPTATPAATTNYVFVVTDTNGCVTSDTLMIEVLGASTGRDTFSFSGTIDTSFVVPTCAGTITIEVWGAEGGYNTSSTVQPGMGAYQKGEFSLSAGTRLKILVGEKPSVVGNGGGGGSFVTLTNNSPLIIAGGGGGSSGGTDSPDKHGQAGQNGGTGAAGGGTGGTAGSGGLTNGISSFQSGAGGGLLTNGSDGWTANSGGQAFVNGGAGANVGFGVGGYGGGGNGSGYVVGAGGGGYSGGGGGGNSSSGVGGGGGSYNSGLNPISTSGVNTGSGRVIISW